jgi:hypothetical protein
MDDSKLENIFYTSLIIIIIGYMLSNFIEFKILLSTFCGGIVTYMFNYALSYHKERDIKFNKIKNFLFNLEIFIRNIIVIKKTIITPDIIEKGYVYNPNLDKMKFNDISGCLDNSDYSMCILIKNQIYDIDNYIREIENIKRAIRTKYIFEEIKEFNEKKYQKQLELLIQGILLKINNLSVLLDCFCSEIDSYIRIKFPEKKSIEIDWNLIIEELRNDCPIIEPRIQPYPSKVA